MSKDLILYEGETIGELRADFEDSIDTATSLDVWLTASNPASPAAEL